jgi:tetraacyldisaccharide 4'-kinase
VIRAAVARALERGALGFPLSHAASRCWEFFVEGSRPVAVPGGSSIVGVGGPTLGGSYKTPLTLALATALHARGASVAVVAHAYRGTARREPARRVAPQDTPRTVGDDALWLYRELSTQGIAVIVGERASALRLAAQSASVVLVDGLLQTRPTRLALSLLCVDALAPWSGGACPPAGDLRASPKALVAAADAVIAVLPPGAPSSLAPDPTSLASQPGAPSGFALPRRSDNPSPERLSSSAIAAALPRHLANRESALTHGTCALPPRPIFDVPSELSATLAGTGASVELAALAEARVGVVLAMARPERFVRSLAAHGVVPVASRLFPDHAVPRPSHSGTGTGTGRPVDAWLTTPKCATKLGAYFEGARVVVVRQDLALPEKLLAQFSR